MQLVRLTQGHSAIENDRDSFTGVWFWVDDHDKVYGRVEITSSTAEQANTIADTIISRTAVEVVKG